MPSAQLKLYQAEGSPNSRRVRIYLAEKGLDVQMVPVDLGAKEQFSDAYKAINPRQVVPTLVLPNGVSIGEVPAICRYLEETFPDKPLLGRNAEEKAPVAMWERRMEQEGFAAVMEGVRNKVAGLKGRAISGPHDYEQIPELVTRNEQRVANFHADLERRLAVSPFVAGQTFSVADITAVVAIDFAKGGLGAQIPEASAATQRWYEALSAKPTFKA